VERVTDNHIKYGWLTNKPAVRAAFHTELGTLAIPGRGIIMRKSPMTVLAMFIDDES
jgi:hypothetical protein